MFCLCILFPKWAPAIKSTTARNSFDEENASFPVLSHRAVYAVYVTQKIVLRFKYILHEILFTCWVFTTISWKDHLPRDCPKKIHSGQYIATYLIFASLTHKWHFSGKNWHFGFPCSSSNFIWYFRMLIKVRKSCFQMRSTFVVHKYPHTYFEFVKFYLYRCV